MSLEELIRDVPDYPKPGIVFKDITPLLADPSGLAEAIRLMADPFRQKGVELVTGAESRGFIVGAAIAAELGAKIVKTYYCAEDFEKVTNGCPVPVVIAGGPKCETELEVFEFVYDGMRKGAIGVNLGRNVWQNPHPAAMMRALNAVVHDNATPKQAFDLFETIKNETS